MKAGRFFEAFGKLLYGLAAIDGHVSTSELSLVATSVEHAANRHFNRHGYFIAGILLSKIAFLKAMERKEHPGKLIREALAGMDDFPLTMLSPQERDFINTMILDLARSTEGIRKVEQEVIDRFAEKMVG